MADYVLILAAYLLGSLSSAVIVCQLMGLPDPRGQGSNNPGATNVLRLGSKPAAALTLFGDTVKGVIPMLLGHWIGVSAGVLALVGLAAFVGHLFPVFFQFKGGKGVATALGVQLGLDWLLGLAVGLVWLFMARVVKISSLSALVSMALAPLLTWFLLQQWQLAGMQLAISIILFWRHRSNIRQLLAGTEKPIGS
jgi:glycerol-3-phosphate acyltransferase PlsY